MQKIKFRTKVEIFGAIVFVALLVAVSAASVTRTITDSTDNSYTFIRNSNGKYWEATGANLQIAVNDLATTGGTVWVGSDITLTSALKINKSYITVDFEDHQVTLGGDISFVNVSSGSTTGACYNTIRNARVKITNGHTASIISLYIKPHGRWVDRVRYNIFENINIINSYANNHAWTGIHLNIDVGEDSPADMANFLFNTFRDITMNSCKTGILLECDDTDAWGNGNLFENIWIDDGFETGVYFKVDSGATNGFNQNLFNNIKLQTDTWSKDGFKNINGNGNHFDHCLVWDWYAAISPNHEWSISSGANKTYICAHYISEILDQGTGTNVANPI